MMNADKISRRLRGAVGNALVWGAGWAALSVGVFAALKVAGFLSPEMIWLDALGIAARLGVAGGVAGGAFSLVVGSLFRGRRLSDLSAVRFGIGGGIMAGLGVPLFLETMSLLSGGGLIPLEYVLGDGVLAGLFGAIAAGGSLKLAQRAEPLLPEVAEPGLVGSGDPLASRGRGTRGETGLPPGTRRSDRRRETFDRPAPPV